MLYQIPSVGDGIDFSQKSSDALKSKEAFPENSTMVDLSQALFHQTMTDESILDISTQSYLDESFVNQSFLQSDNDVTISEILTENLENQDIWSKKEDSSRPSSGSSSPLVEDLITKRKSKKYAILADLKLAKSFDEIKPKLAHQVNNFLKKINNLIMIFIV